MLAQMAQWLVDTIFDWGYWGIFLLMAVESSFIPFPSEVVLIPAGYLVSKGEMNAVLAMFSAIAGSLAGAFINYFGALWIGRRALERYGHYVLIKPETLHKMDAFFRDHGPISTFTGRLIPAVRQLISIPAGLAKMDLRLFSLYTALGAGIWSLILVVLGYVMGENEALIKAYLPQITLGAVAVAVVLIAVYMYRHRQKAKQN
ncbi:MAG: DedA family protein [Campylobacterales bacterium]|nr:DedA family protein [Campylobacterales bacterium]